MIQMPIDVRPEFMVGVLDFCSKNNLDWGDVYSESWLQGVVGKPHDVNKLLKHIEVLEIERKERRNKRSLLWRIFN